MSLRTKIDGLKQIWRFDNRYQLALERTLSKNNLATYRYKGLEILTDRNTGDDVGVREVLATDTYRKHVRQMELPAAVNVLDIGANIGAFPILLLSEGIKFKKFACVEFNPKTFARMRENVERNTDAEFHAINAAVCGKSGMLEVKLGEGGLNDNIYGRDIVDGHTSRIEARTFDAIYEDIFGDDEVHICKIDIEGAEFEILRSGTCERLQRCRYLLMEIHHEKTRNQDRSEVIGHLEGAGFREVDGGQKQDAFHHVHFFVNEHR